MNGRNCANAMKPTATGELCVSCRISHAWAIRCIHVPVTETIWPEKNSL